MSTLSGDTCEPTYCGRVNISVNGTGDYQLSPCGPCPWGTRRFADANPRGLCLECTEPLALFDWLYLVFTVSVPLAVNCQAIEWTVAQVGRMDALQHKRVRFVLNFICK